MIEPAPPPSPHAAGRHLDALTGIRGIAAWLVVFYHIRLSLVALLPPEAISVFAQGYLAVDLFFVLSGFVMWYTYADKLRAGGGAATRRFLWRRVARIWPLHLFVLALFALFAAALALTGRDTAGYPLDELPLHVLLLQNWGFTGALTWNHPAWSISTEFSAYLWFPLLVLVLRWDRLPRLVLPLAALALVGLLHSVFAARGLATLGEDIPRMGLVRCVLEFTLGTLVCAMWQAFRQTSRAAWVAAAVAVTAMVGWLIGGAAQTFAVPVAFAALILAVALQNGATARILSSRPVLYLGEISYSTYLVHFFLFIVFKIAFVDESLQLGWGGLTAFLISLLAASAALYHGVEKPAQRWLNRPRPVSPDAARPMPAE